MMSNKSELASKAEDFLFQLAVLRLIGSPAVLETNTEVC